MTKILYGNKLACKIKEKILLNVKKNFLNVGINPPHLGIILVGDNQSSHKYVKNKIKECKNIGIHSTLITFSKNCSENTIKNQIYKFNKNPLIDGLIVQFPLEKHINKNNIILSINPKKDVDGIHPENVGKMILGIDSFIPATALGIIKLLHANNIEINGKSTLVIGRSLLVGRPISILMSRKSNFGNSTVTIAHSYTKNLKYYINNSDIIIVAIGKQKFINGSMIKRGSVIIDVGINVVSGTNKILGDVDFESIVGKASYLTPVPGGIGPLTRIMLLNNTLHAAIKYRLYN